MTQNIEHHKQYGDIPSEGFNVAMKELLDTGKSYIKLLVVICLRIVKFQNQNFD